MAKISRMPAESSGYINGEEAVFPASELNTKRRRAQINDDLGSPKSG